MKRNFTNENLERFLRQNADGLRMQPSEKVWKGISNHLNRRRRRFGFFMGIGLLLTTCLGYYFTSSADNTINKIAAIQPAPPSSVHDGSLNSIALSKKDQDPIPVELNKDLITGTDQNNPGSYSFTGKTSSNSTDLLTTATSDATKAETINDFSATIVDSYSDDAPYPENTTSANTLKAPTDPLTIESVLNSYQPRVRNGKFGMQLYFTPTISYRKLNDTHIDNVVTHKPDFGFELGLAAKYRIGNYLKVRGGFQFNVNRYGIKTYNATTQLATIRLNNRFGIDSFNTVTNYNNFGGYKSNWLENFFFQVSAPVGLELKLRGDEKMQFGVASTIQPTYILGDRAYLISSDYKNYAEVPRLIRRWNVNTSLETFVAYSTGKLKWQVGPQVRYQLLSSYVKKYPVKENLFDFGLKVGISLNNQ